MTNPVEPPPVETGSSSQQRLPYHGFGMAVGADATVISAPRATDGSSPSDSGTTLATSPLVPPSPISMALFPGQQRAENQNEIEGTLLGHFRIRRRIGAGGMGTVFLADDEKLQRPVALKVLSPQQTADPASVHRFLNEARSAARLDHDHIARVFFYGDDQGLHYIAYEYVQGANLRDLIRSQTRIEAADVVAYALQLASALCHTSSAGVVHRDIKPSNIIITHQGKAKLVDLGLARKESLEESAHLTVAGTTLGTFDYISPEQAKDPRNVDVRSDIYSLGCTLYHALTGEPPFPEGTVLQRLLDHQEKEPPDPAIKNRRVSPALSAVVRKMMAVDPKRRYPTAEALLSDLLVVAATMGLRTSLGPETHYAELLRPRHTWWSQNANWVLAATGLLIAAAIWQAFPQLTQPTESLATISGPAAESPVIVPAEPPVTGTDSPSLSMQPATTTPILAERTLTTPNVKPLPVDTATEPTPIATAAADGSASPRPVGIDTELKSILFPPFSDPSLQDVFSPMTLRPLPTTVTDNSTPGSSGTTGPAVGPNVAGMSPPRVPDAPSAPEVIASTAGSADAKLPQNPISPAGSSGTSPAAVVNQNTLPFLILGTGQSYATLEAACMEVRDQGVIELHYDGRRAVPERPMRIVNKRITIQAARGRKPVITFAPKGPSGDPLQARMMTVSGGSLALANLAIEMQVRPGSTADLWAMFRIERPDRLRLQNVHLTIVNPSLLAAAVVESAAPATTSFTKMGAMKDALPVIPTEVLIEQSVIRGEANGLVLHDAMPFNLEFRQSLLAIGEWLVQQEFAPDVMSTSSRLSIDLTNTTCVLGQGLIRVVDDDDVSGRQLPIQITARNNIFSCGPGAPLIEQQFAMSTMDVRKFLIWSEEHNRFDGIDTFWLVRFVAPPEEDRWDFNAWKSWWERSEVSDSLNTPVVWAQPVRNRSFSQIRVQDVKHSVNGELQTANPLPDALLGAPLEQLPTEPAE
ncbi:protein kinase [bacterium]|nr:protein kinase [bacterium]